MDIFFEILKYILPALVVLGATYVVLSKQLANEADRRNFELRKLNVNQITPVRLRAYERLTLLLERTKPEAMLLRLNLSNLSNFDLQTQLLKTIRDEFDHNMGQQIYVSPEAWTLVMNARESLMRLVNGSAAQVQPSDSAMQLAQSLIQTYAATETTPTDVALNILKQEVKSM